MTYGNIINHKKSGPHPFFQKHIFDKTIKKNYRGGGGGLLPLPANPLPSAFLGLTGTLTRASFLHFPQVLTQQNLKLKIDLLKLLVITIKFRGNLNYYIQFLTGFHYD